LGKCKQEGNRKITKVGGSQRGAQSLKTLKVPPCMGHISWGLLPLAMIEDAKLTLGESVRDSRNLEVLSKPEGLSTFFFL